MSAPGKKYNTIDEYIYSFPENVQDILEKFRRVIKESAPEAEETINYGIPTFKLNGKNLAHFAAFKNHIGFYPTPSAIIVFKKELSTYKQAKGSVQLPIDKPIPFDIVKKIVKFRVKEDLAKGRNTVANPKTTLKRSRHPMPDFVRQALIDNNIMEDYSARPPYQRNDYIGWINRAAQDVTKQKRLNQMIEELKKGDVYMKMAYKPKLNK